MSAFLQLLFAPIVALVAIVVTLLLEPVRWAVVHVRPLRLPRIREGWQGRGTDPAERA